MKLTNTNITKLSMPQGMTDKIWFDDEIPGFGVRLRSAGSRKFVVHYRIGGQQRRQTLGSVGVLKLDEARRKARKVLVAVDDGRDPAAEKAVSRAAAGLRFAAVRTEYLEARKDDMKPRSLVETSRHLERDWKLLDHMALSNVTRAIVAAQVRTLAKVHGIVSANRSRSSLSSFFAWAIGEGLCETNPVIGTNRAGEEQSRERILTDVELAKIWNAAPSNDYGAIVKLLMLTAQRREEIAGLAWDELTLTGKSPAIALPAARTKNGRPHDVPLSNAAVSLLETRTAIDGRALVFGSGEGGYSGWSRSKESLDAIVKLPDWTLHDLRRTVATRMADLGVQPHVIEAVLNHVSGHKSGVAGIYNRSTYADEKRAALDLWAGHLRVVIAKAAGANVTTLKRA